MHYRYVKAPVSSCASVVSLPVGRRLWSAKLLPLLLLVAGLSLVSFAAVPILFYQVFVSSRFTQLIKPIPDNPTEQAVLGTTSGADMTQVSNWLPNAPALPSRPSKITHYNLSIPKLKIQEAVVEIGGEDLKKSLIHYPGTALPGQFGNAVIFGHSVLPQFFNQKDYKTIFSTLPTLKLKDEIIVNFDGVTYRYVIEEMVEVKPDDISILEQRYDDSYITLITCVPPGTYLRRLIVRARLTPN